MKAAYIQSTGTPEQIIFGELPEPTCSDNQVLIRVMAVSMNPVDTYVRGGLIAFDLPPKFVVGCDAAGIVEAVGSNVTNYQIGDRVWCTNQGLLGRQGTFAEKIAIDSDWCFPIPSNVTFADAAALALVGVTAHLGLFREANLQAGETILVIGGTGGVGSVVVQMAKAMGARVITTASTPEKCEKARLLGADIVINYHDSSIQDVVATEAPDGVEVFWETRREPDFDSAVAMMAQRGRMVLMAGRDARPEFPVGPFYVKECSLHGFVMFKATPAEMRVAADDMNQWMSTEKLSANIAKTLTLDEVVAAHRLQEAATIGGDQSLAGKIVLTVSN